MCETKEETTKVCATCGQVKPLSAFNKYSMAADGHRSTCISCYYKKNNYGDKKFSDGGGVPQHVVEGEGNPKLVGITPRELIEELRYRGYRGKLTFTKVIEL